MTSVFSSSLFFAHHFPWFEQQFLEEIVPRWKAAAPQENGCFHTSFDKNWNRIEQPAVTLVSQARMLYLFSHAFRRTGNVAFRKLVVDGARFLGEYCADKERGGFCWSVTNDGEWVDTTRDAYGHAFALLGLIHTFDITGDISALKGALRAYKSLTGRFTDKRGGLAWKMTPSWEDIDSARSQNPVMHSVEALLALLEIVQNRKPPLPDRPGGHAELCSTIKHQITGYVKHLFLGSGTRWRVPLPENFDLQWEPLSADNGGLFMTGHQFEWAYLLSEAARNGLGKQLIDAGSGCIDTALENGCDILRGILWSSYDETGAIRDRTLSWWAYSEAIRALLRYGHDHNREDLLEVCTRLVAFARDNFVDVQSGGWYQTLDETGKVLIADKGSIWKLDYHQTGMCMEAMRLAVT